MSLAMYAASFNDNSSPDNSDNIINQKRHKRTQRKYPKIENFNSGKVNSILDKIHNTTDDTDSDDNYDFNPPPKPVSMNAQKTIPVTINDTENFDGMNISFAKTLGKAPIPTYEGGDNLDLNDYNNYGDQKTAEEYYKKILPGHSKQNNHTQETRNYYKYKDNNVNEYPTQDGLMSKLNYIISLLEENQDEKTNNVTEEVILYSFLGIFIIFIADTFVRVGKYTR